MFLFDQVLAQGNHEENAQEPAGHGQEGHLQESWLHLPHEECGQREDDATGDGAGSRADRLGHVGFENRARSAHAMEETESGQRHDGNGNRGGNGQPGLETKVGVGRAEEDTEDDARDCGLQRELEGRLAGGDIGSVVCGWGLGPRGFGDLGRIRHGACSSQMAAGWGREEFYWGLHRLAITCTRWLASEDAFFLHPREYLQATSPLPKTYGGSRRPSIDDGVGAWSGPLLFVALLGVVIRRFAWISASDIASEPALDAAGRPRQECPTLFFESWLAGVLQCLFKRRFPRPLNKKPREGVHR